MVIGIQSRPGNHLALWSPGHVGVRELPPIHADVYPKAAHSIAT